MTFTDTVIIGGGQAGLAISHSLTEMDREHLVLERGQVAERWRSGTWDSLRLLSPNWMTRLPGWTYDGQDPTGFMTAEEVVSFFTRYASSFTAPVLENVTVQRVAESEGGFDIRTDHGRFRARNVVIATGWCERAAIPSIATSLSGHIDQVDPAGYRNPSGLTEGGVLVVGASATGVQLADEIRASGREVILAVGAHSRMPRRHRGMDIFWWLDMMGSFDKTVDDIDAPAGIRAARDEPSLQLVGRADHTTIDLSTLDRSGVRIVGRLEAIDSARVRFGDDLARTVADADRQMGRVLDRIDSMIDRTGLTAEVDDAEPSELFRPGETPRSIDLDAAGIRTVVWATGHRRPYEWLDLPIRDRRGEIEQYRGVTPLPGAYVLGQRFQHFRNSNFIDGIGRDARFVAAHIVERSSTSCSALAPSRPTTRKRVTSWI